MLAEPPPLPLSPEQRVEAETLYRLLETRRLAGRRRTLVFFEDDVISISDVAPRMDVVRRQLTKRAKIKATQPT